MKLYTEEQLRRCYDGLLQNVGTSVKESDLPSVDDYINSLTPIELPSDKEIEEQFTIGIDMRTEYTHKIEGAKWMKEQITNNCLYINKYGEQFVINNLL